MGNIIRRERDRLRLALEQDRGTGGGGGNPPANPPADPPADPPKQGDDKGGQGDPPKPEAKFTQADLDRLVNDRLAEEKRRQEKREADLKRKAEEDALKANNEWEKIATQRQTRIEELEAEMARTKREAIVTRVAAKHKLPDELAARLVGTTEEEIEADAAKVAKLVAPPKPPEPETGGGGNRGGWGDPDRAKAERDKMRLHPRYQPY